MDEEEKVLGEILSKASRPQGFTIKNPYCDDYLKLCRVEYGIIVLNDLTAKKITKLPAKFKRIIMPKILKTLMKEL